MKQVVKKTYRYESHLGKATFRNVPVWLVDDLTGRTNDVALDDQVAMAMEREVAKDWLARRAEPDKLSPQEIDAVRIIFGLNLSEFARLLRLTKGTMSKIFHGKLKLQRPMSDLCLLLLACELLNPGTAKRALNEELTDLVGRVPKPQYDLKKLA